MYCNQITNIMKKVLKFPQHNRKLIIVQDENATNPRKDCDYLGKCLFFGAHSHLGDKHQINSNDYNSFEEMKKALIKKGASVILPVYAYKHSGMTIATTPFSCRWDSGQLGFIVAWREDILKEYGCKIVSKKTKEKVSGILEAEIGNLRNYIEGEVYGFKLKDLETKEELDSCWGFLGNPIESGIIEHLDFEITENDFEKVFDEAEWK